MSAQIKSKRRVSDHGEVFTNPREVNAMLDLVKQETERIESRFFEPACGTGNFLTEILKRKLEVVKKRYGKNLHEYEKYSFIAVGSIYGVELLADNATECRKRLYDIFLSEYTKVAKSNQNADFLTSIRYLFERNILCGDALSLLQDDGEPIIFSEWSLVSGDYVKRRDFRLDEMLQGSENAQQPSLFGMSGTPATEWEYDEETKAYIPLPIRELPLMNYWEVASRV